jgi:hypothetical protein
MAAVPIMVKTTRRERFMWRLPSGFGGLFVNGHQFPSAEGNEASESRLFHRIVRPTPVHQPPPEKCDVNARANDPKPPRVTPPEVESDEVPGAKRLDEESLLNKPLRDGDPPEPPRPPLDEDSRGVHSALVCNPDAIPGRFCSQFSLGINA